MFPIIIDILKSFIELIQKKKESEKIKIIQISEVLEQIYLIINDTIFKLENDEYPHGNCKIMRSLSEKLHDKLIGIIPDEDVEELIKLMIQASTLEKEYHNRKDEETINKLEEVAGEFKSMSLILKIN